MKILLIHPYISSNNRFTVLTEPIGLLCLASYMEESGYEVEILDLYARGVDSIVKRGKLYTKGVSDKPTIIQLVRGYRPDLIGITCNFTEYAPDAFELAKLIKSNINVLLVIGGAHVSMDAEDTLRQNEAIDVVVRGEGEIVFKRLIEAVECGRTFDNIEGITYKNNKGEIISNPKQTLIKDMDTLPIPDRSKIPMNIYLRTNSMALQFIKKEPVATIMTSRGCPFNCIFCSSKAMWERKWRPRSPEKVLEEIEALVTDFGVNEVAIYDDQFIVDKRRVERLCDLLIERKLDISLSIPSGTSVWLAGEKLLKKMKRAGFYRLCFPIETGNENTMKFIKKPINLKDTKKLIKIANRIGFWTQGNFIIGFPYESKEEIRSTIKYAYDSGLDYAFFYIAQPCAGSEMYEIFKKEGLLMNIARLSNVERAGYDTKTMKAHELQFIRNRASSWYLPRKLLTYMNPINFYNMLLPKLSSIDDIRYALKIFIKIIKKAFRDKISEIKVITGKITDR